MQTPCILETIVLYGLVSNTAARLWTEGEHAAVCHQISFTSTRQEIENRHVGVARKLEDTA